MKVTAWASDSTDMLLTRHFWAEQAIERVEAAEAARERADDAFAQLAHFQPQSLVGRVLFAMLYGRKVHDLLRERRRAWQAYYDTLGHYHASTRPIVDAWLGEGVPGEDEEAGG